MQPVKSLFYLKTAKYLSDLIKYALNTDINAY
jgi:hypothetical protein